MRVVTLWSFLSRVAVAAGLVVGLATSAGAEPALFVARDADTTIYLFGTVHVVPCAAINLETELGLRIGEGAIAPTGCAEWMTDAVEAALEEADELWLETPDLLDGPMDPALLDELGLLKDQVLTDLMPAEELRAIAQAIAGPAADGLLPEWNRMQPWVVMSFISQVVMARANLSTTVGVDISLGRMAAERGIPVRGFETFAEQAGMVAADPLEIQAADLRALAALVNLDLDLEGFLQWTLEKTWTAWLEGDLETVAFLILSDAEAFFDRYASEIAALLNLNPAELPETVRQLNAVYEGLVDPAQRELDRYESLVAQRNRNWMPAIGDMLARPGTFFVAVGAGHLSGDAALQTLVEQAGATVERVQ